MNNLKNRFLLLIIFSLVFIYGGCITFQYQHYVLNINDDGSGTGTIVYENVVSQLYSEDDNANDDFDKLINDYLNGTELEYELPNIKIIDKKLFEKNGKLMGEVSFSFSNLEEIRMYQHNNSGPYMYYIDSFKEIYVESNGEYPGSNFPVVFWDNTTKPLKLTTNYSEVNFEDTTFVSLLERYKDWKSKK